MTETNLGYEGFNDILTSINFKRGLLTEGVILSPFMIWCALAQLEGTGSCGLNPQQLHNKKTETQYNKSIFFLIVLHFLIDNSMRAMSNQELVLQTNKRWIKHLTETNLGYKGFNDILISMKLKRGLLGTEGEIFLISLCANLCLLLRLLIACDQIS